MSKINIQDRLPVVILGLSLTALGVMRSLGRKGIRIIGLDYKERQIAVYSKYCEALCCPDPDKFSNELLFLLINLQKKLHNKTVLIPTSDEFVMFVSRNRSELGAAYDFRLPSSEVVELLNDKREFYRIARKNNVPTPKTFMPKSIDDIADISRKIEYPCVIKPAFGYMYKYFYFKAILLKNACELLESCKNYEKCMDSILIQELIPGRDDAQYSVAAYFNVNHEPLAIFSSRKIRQIPPRFGTGTLVTSCLEPTITNTAVTFLKKLNYQGIAEVEFKKSSKDSRFMMIETNTRFWTQNSLATRCGIDLPYIAYMDTLGREVERCFQRKQSIKWINFYDDFLACFGSSGYFEGGDITVRKWFSSLICKIEYSIFSIRDFLPFAQYSKAILYKIIKSIICKSRLKKARCAIIRS